jgi:glycosyltransferase involved in cell wall biosynthesis
MKDLVTIVIPCKNEESYIGNLLKDIAEQVDAKGVRIIIADANSTDNTISVIKEHQKIYKANINIIEGGLVDIARNNGLRLVKTPYTFFIDADVRFFDKNLLRDTLYYLKHENYGLVTAKLKCYRGSLFTKSAYRFYNLVHHFLVKKYPFAIGAYFCVKTKDLIRRGMFVEESDNSGDFLTSQKYKSIEFKVMNHQFIGQDDRRIQKMGLFGMGKHLVLNFYNYLRGKENFNERAGYWD